MNQSEGNYCWHHPMGVGTNIFKEFVNEANAVIGTENTDLLKAVDDALNAEGKRPELLSLTAEQAEEHVAAWLSNRPDLTEERRELRRQQYLNHLAFLYEISYRREHGPEMFERNAAVIPCPDFLPANSHQVPAGSFARFNRLSKIWNWTLVLVFAGTFPLVIMPFFTSLLQSKSIGFRIVVAAVWAVILSVGLVCRSVSRSLHGRKPGSFKVS